MSDPSTPSQATLRPHTTDSSWGRITAQARALCDDAALITAHGDPDHEALDRWAEFVAANWRTGPNVERALAEYSTRIPTEVTNRGAPQPSPVKLHLARTGVFVALTEFGNQRIRVGPLSLYYRSTTRNNRARLTELLQIAQSHTSEAVIAQVFVVRWLLSAAIRIAIRSLTDDVKTIVSASSTTDLPHTDERTEFLFNELLVVSPPNQRAILAGLRDAMALGADLASATKKVATKLHIKRADIEALLHKLGSTLRVRSW